MFASDAATFLQDFGSPVSWAPSTGGSVVQDLMIFDMAAEVLDSTGTISSQFKVTFETAAWAGLKRGEVLVIGVTDDGLGGGASYRLKTAPMALEDGVFSSAPLEKVRP